MKLRRANPWILPVILALLLYGIVSLVLMEKKLAEARTTAAEMETRVEELEKENEQLQYAVDHPEDPDVIADVARDKLGLIMPGEQVYQDPAAD